MNDRQFPALSTHLAETAKIVKSQTFKQGIVKAINSDPMSQEEATAVSFFEAEIIEVLETEDGAELSLAERALARKKRKIEALRYGNLKWIPPTSNIAERFFSKV